MKAFSRIPRAGVAAMATILFLSTCTTIPDTGRKSFNLYGQKQLVPMGLSAFQQFKQKKKISRDPRKNAAVQRVAARLTRVIDLPGAQWEFVVFEDSTPNAFALPGGKVGVHTGMFDVCKNEAQLAAVIGHEIGHVVANHAGERMTNATVAKLGGALLGVATQGTDNAAALMKAYGYGVDVAGMKPFGRKQELESDRLGALYMARAGYHPQEAVNLWINFSNFKKRSGAARPPAFLSTHPVDEKRIAELQKFLPQAMAQYTGS